MGDGLFRRVVKRAARFSDSTWYLEPFLKLCQFEVTQHFRLFGIQACGASVRGAHPLSGLSVSNDGGTVAAFVKELDIF